MAIVIFHYAKAFNERGVVMEKFAMTVAISIIVIPILLGLVLVIGTNMVSSDSYLENEGRLVLRMSGTTFLTHMQENEEVEAEEEETGAPGEI